MDYTEYTTVKNRFSSTPNLCDLFKLLSIETWKRIEYAYLKSGVKVYETTITQNLIFTINAYDDQFGLNIDIFEAANERVNGNDFELIIKFLSENLEFYAPIQAKKVYRDGSYRRMEHGVQIQSLMDYANAHDAKPFYLLYNFSSSRVRPELAFPIPVEHTGCTLISAQYLFDNYYNRREKSDGTLAWKIPSFDDLNPDHAFAWHELVCPSNSTELIKLLKAKGLANKNLDESGRDLVRKNKDLKQGFYELNSISRDGNWTNTKDLIVPQKEEYIDGRNIEIRPIDSVLRNDEDRNIISSNKQYKVEKVYPEYSPKSRIVITKT